MNRTTRAQKFTWNADGTPNFGVPVAARHATLPPRPANPLPDCVPTVARLCRARHGAQTGSGFVPSPLIEARTFLPGLSSAKQRWCQFSGLPLELVEPVPGDADLGAGVHLGRVRPRISTGQRRPGLSAARDPLSTPGRQSSARRLRHASRSAARIRYTFESRTWKPSRSYNRFAATREGRDVRSTVRAPSARASRTASCVKARPRPDPAPPRRRPRPRSRPSARSGSGTPPASARRRCAPPPGR